MTTTGLAILFAVAATNWVAVLIGSKPLEYLAKPATLIVLIIVALYIDPADDTAHAVLIVALGLSLAGDVFLMLPGRAQTGSRTFLSGLASFLLAHLAFIAAFWLAGTEPLWLIPGAAAAALVVVLVGRPVISAVRANESLMAGPVAVYIGVIAVMVLSAIGTGDPWAIAGAALFATSDSLIAKERFMRQDPWGPLGIITTYHLAQVMIVASFVA